MGYVDFILNLAGLLLWLNWRSDRFDPLVKRLSRLKNYVAFRPGEL